MACGEHWLLGSILIGRYRTPARRAIHAPADIGHSEFDHWVLRVVTKGVLVSSQSGRTFRAFPAQMTIGSFDRSDSDDDNTGDRIAAMVPRHALPGLDFAQATCAPILLSGAKASLLADFLTSLVRRLPEAVSSDLPAIEAMARAMIAASFAGDTTSLTLLPAERSVVLRELVDWLIRDNLALAGLNPERICALAGISRSTLYRLFEERGGVASHVQALRLERVHADLSNPQFASKTIASIAASRGLRNVAVFNRAFRRHFGCTPGDVRAAALRGDSKRSA